MWELNCTLWNNNGVKEEIKRKIKKYFKTKENEMKHKQNLWDAVKRVLRGKFIAISTHIKKKDLK